MLTVTEAGACIRALIRPVGAELVSIDDALGRFLAEEVIAPWSLPPCDNSAMDGFAMRAQDLPPSAEALPVALPVAGVIAAGDAPGAVLAPGTALRIMTGAPMPRGADTVIIREDVDDRGDRALFAQAARPGGNIRRAGEDVAAGAVVLRSGMRMGPGEIGMAVALGRATVAVGRRPRVAILSSGDELVAAGMRPRPGQIANSNAHALAAQVREAGGEPILQGIAPDEPAALAALVHQGLRADVLITSGGVSVGDYDHVKAALTEAGVSVEFWKVAMKPGKPLVFGMAPGERPVFGLPGNPVSSMVVFELFVRPVLLAMQGAAAHERPRALVVIDDAYEKTPGRAHYLRATVRRDGDILRARILGKQGSGMLSSMVNIDALVELERDLGAVPAGARLPALLLRPA